MTGDTFHPFHPFADLPTGVTLLEASAGTGKTHAVASFVAAEVAKGTPLDRILVVTFTRKAAGTLRDRVWRRLEHAAAALHPEAGPPPPHDELLTALHDGDAEAVAKRRSNLLAAASTFDAATIATTHGFCQQVLAGLGVAGDAEREMEVVEHVRDIVRDAVDDLFVRRIHEDRRIGFGWEEAVSIAKAVVEHPTAQLADVDGRNDADRVRLAFARRVRERVDDEKRRGRLITYDDLQGRLERSLTGDLKDVAGERLRRRFSVAVVDEFQDTDVTQWRILQTAFDHPATRLVLVGDPKQSIYAFRGGDVHAYLRAVAAARTRLRLGVSWRADQPLLDGLDDLLDGASLGDPEIVHSRLRARPGAEGRRMAGPAVGAPLQVRILDRHTAAVERTKGGLPTTGSARQAVAADVARCAGEMLAAGTTLQETDVDGVAREVGPLERRHLAVLVRTHTMAELVRRELERSGVPAVVHGGTVLATEAAQAWAGLLRAIERPAVVGRVRTLALGPFVGWAPRRVALATDDEWDALREELHDWMATFRLRGIAGLARRVRTSQDLPRRLLGQPGGERLLSDLRHVGELLHARHSSHPGSVATLAAWLDEEIADAATDDGEVGRRRLATDADAVPILTLHAAKGLEFPVVLLPSLWDVPRQKDDNIPVFHDGSGVRSIGVGRTGDIHDAQVRAARHELAAEELRLLYVGLTRARHQIVVWWASTNEAGRSGLARMLLGRGPGAELPDAFDAVPHEDDVRAAVERLAAARPGVFSIAGVGGARAARGPAATSDGPPRALEVATFGRGFDTAWVRTSYSALTAAAHDAGPAATAVADIDDVPLVDEPALDGEGASDRPGEGGPPLPLADLVGGAAFGSLVHDILEHTDFAAADLASELSAAAAAAGAARMLQGGVTDLVLGLEAALSTPLGPLFDDRALTSLGRGDRLDELAFDLPLAGGDRPSGIVTMEAVADVLAGLPPDDPLARYHERLREPPLAAAIRGYLTGSIDLVARIGARHVVVDYKTNRLAPAGTPLLPHHYRPSALAAAMQDAHYPLQAVLYAVALHRYLRWRLPGYDPATNLGGIAYLFVRGMSGPGAAGAGVFSWRPPASLVVALSDLLDRGAAP